MRIGHFQDSTFPCAPTDHLTQTINNLKKLSANNLHFQSTSRFYELVTSPLIECADIFYSIINY